MRVCLAGYSRLHLQFVAIHDTGRTTVFFTEDGTHYDENGGVIAYSKNHRGR